MQLCMLWLYTGQADAIQPRALFQINVNKDVRDSCSQLSPPCPFQKQSPSKLEPALSGTHRYSLSVKKTAGAFILHLALAE